MWGDLGEKMIVLSAESDQHMKVSFLSSDQHMKVSFPNPTFFNFSRIWNWWRGIWGCHAKWLICGWKIHHIHKINHHHQLPPIIYENQEDHQKKAVLGIFGEEREVGMWKLSQSTYNRSYNRSYWTKTFWDVDTLCHVILVAWVALSCIDPAVAIFGVTFNGGRVEIQTF